MFEAAFLRFIARHQNPRNLTNKKPKNETNKKQKAKNDKRKPNSLHHAPTSVWTCPALNFKTQNLDTQLPFGRHPLLDGWAYIYIYVHISMNAAKTITKNPIHHHKLKGGLYTRVMGVGFSPSEEYDFVSWDH